MGSGLAEVEYLKENGLLRFDRKQVTHTTERIFIRYDAKREKKIEMADAKTGSDQPINELDCVAYLPSSLADQHTKSVVEKQHHRTDGNFQQKSQSLSSTGNDVSQTSVSQRQVEALRNVQQASQSSRVCKPSQPKKYCSIFLYPHPK